MSLKIVAVSDTHEQHKNLILPDGDVLIHSGDITNKGSLNAFEEFCNWMSTQNFAHKILIYGNHELGFQIKKKQKAADICKKYNIIHLQNSSVEINNYKIWGASWTPFFFNWEFNLHRGKDIAVQWAKIPDDTNVLITHGPPYGILDLVQDNIWNAGRDLHQGCADLLQRVKELKQLKAHIFGHLHLNGGKTQVENGVIFGNASICTEAYTPTNSPLVIEI